MGTENEMTEGLYTYRARLKRVVNGDTVDFHVDLGFGITLDIRVVLARIDAPEMNHGEREEGLQASNALLRVLEGADEIFLHTECDKGKYGRYIAEVIVAKDGTKTVVNDWMVKEGLAKYRET